MRALVAELVGTFVLVLAGCGAIATGGSRAEIAAAFGLAVGTMVYALSHISGAHLIPAVSLGFAIGRHVPWSKAAGYSLAQILGAVLAAAALRASFPEAALGVTRPAVPGPQAVAWETMLTFILMLVIMAVATDTRAVGQAAAMAIGGAVSLDALVGGPVTGASMNPARSIGPALVSGQLEDLWVYVLGPVAGAALAAVVYRYLRGPLPGPRAG